MDRLKLRFPEHHHPEMPLTEGVHAFGRIGDTVGQVDEVEAPLIRLFVDRRGVWMTVTEGARGVHVNGRPVQRMAMLRLGDSIYLDGVEMVLMTERRAESLPDALRHVPGEFRGDPRVVVRGVGGQHHGRSFTLEAPRLVGRSDDADIRIDDAGFAERHARIEMIGDRIVLRDLGAGEGSVVNGEPMRDAFLMPGDQVVFDTHHRFVIEAPAPTTAQLVRTDAHHDEPNGSEVAVGVRKRDRHLPWLLLAAASIAAILAGLLAWGGS